MKKPVSSSSRFQTFDLLATLVAVVHSDGAVLFANAALEDALGISRRAIVGASLADWFTDPAALREALARAHDRGVARREGLHG